MLGVLQWHERGWRAKGEGKCWKRVRRVIMAKDVETDGANGVEGDGGKGCEGKCWKRVWTVMRM